MGLHTDLKVEYRFNDEEDSWRGEYDLTNNGTVTFVDGNLGKAASFNGVDQYLSASAPAGSPFQIDNQSWGIALWYKYDVNDSGSQVTICGLENTDWKLEKLSGDHLQLFVNSSGGIKTVFITNIVEDTWYFIVADYNADTETLRLRLDDSSESTSDLTGITITSRASNFNIGRHNGSSYMEGFVENLRIRKGSVWTAAEITTMYNSGAGYDRFFSQQNEVTYTGEDLYDRRGNVFADLTDTGSVTNPSGKVGNCFEFSGSSQRLTSENHIFKYIGDEEFCGWGWLWSDDLANAGIMGQNNNSYSLQLIASSDKLRLRVDTTGGAITLDHSTVLSSATWYHYYWYHDPTANTIGLSINNGTPETASTSGDAPEHGSIAFTLGSIAAASHFNGKLDEVGFRRGGLLSTDERDYHYNSGTGAAHKTEIQLDYNFTGSTARRVKVEAKAAELSGTGTINATPWLITAAQLPDELIDSDEATADITGAPTLRASLNEDGTGQIPLKVIDFTPAAGGSGGGAAARIWKRADTYTGGSALPVYYWWDTGADKNQPPASAAFGSQEVYSDHFVAFDAVTDPTGDTGDVPDSAGNYDGTSAGSIATLVSGPGSIANAWDLDGTDDEITFGTAEMGTESTIKLWAQKDDIVSRGTYVGKHSTSGGNQYLFLINGSNDYETHIQNFRSGGSPTTAWEHLVVTFKVNGSDTDRKIYRDGVLLAAASVTHTGTLGTVAGGKEWVIGQEWDGTVKGDWFDGKLAAFRMIQSVDTNIADIAATEYSNQNDAASFWDTTFAVTSPGASGNDVTGSVTQGGQTLSGAVTTTVSASGALTQGATSLSGTAEVVISTSGALAQGGQALAGTVETDDAIDISGSLTQGGQQLSGTAEVVISASGGLTQGAQVVSGSATITLSVSGSLTQGGQALSGTVTGPIIAAYATGTTSVFARATGTISINP